MSPGGIPVPRCAGTLTPIPGGSLPPRPGGWLCVVVLGEHPTWGQAAAVPCHVVSACPQPFCVSVCPRVTARPRGSRTSSDVEQTRLPRAR